MASHYEAPIRKPLVTGNKSYHDVTLDVAAPVEGKANTQWSGQGDRPTLY